jgi:hypothetical protein
MVVPTLNTHKDRLGKVNDKGAVASGAIDQPPAMIYPGRDLSGGIAGGRFRKCPKAHPHIHSPDHDQIRFRLQVLMLNDVIHQ